VIMTKVKAMLNNKFVSAELIKKTPKGALIKLPDGKVIHRKDKHLIILGSKKGN